MSPTFQKGLFYLNWCVKCTKGNILTPCQKVSGCWHLQVVYILTKTKFHGRLSNLITSRTMIDDQSILELLLLDVYDKVPEQQRSERF